MANLDQFENDLRDRRTLRGWSQEQLARRSGLSRAGISAIETDRLIPSAAAALALAAALECRVEDLFRLRGSESHESSWAWSPRTRAMPILEGRGGWAYQVIPRGNDRDGLGPSRRCLSKRVVPRRRRMRPRAYAGHGLVRSCGRIIGGPARPRRRHSTDRFTACQPHGTVVDRWRAGACRGRASHNGRAARAETRRSFAASWAPGITCSVLARWEEGIAFASGLRLPSIREAVRTNLRWVGREDGSGARQCLDELLGDRRPPGAWPQTIAAWPRPCAADGPTRAFAFV